jgi:signal transduction histidine kinase
MSDDYKNSALGENAFLNNLKLQLEKRLTSIISLVVILVMIIIIAVVSYTTNIQNQAASYKIIENTFLIFTDTIKNTKNDLSEYTGQLAKTGAIIDRFEIIDNGRDLSEEQTVKSLIYEMLNQLNLISLTNRNVDEVMIYNNQGQLIVFYTIQKELIRAGAYSHFHKKYYQSYQIDIGKPLEKELQGVLANQVKPSISYQYPIPEKTLTQFEVLENRLALSSIVPIYSEKAEKKNGRWQVVKNRSGFIKAISYFELGIIQRMSKWSGTHFSVSLKSGSSFGSLEAFPSFDFSLFPDSPENRTFEDQSVLYDEIQIGDASYFRGSFPIYSDQEIVAAVNSHYTQEIARKNTYQMVKLLTIIFLVSIILLIPIFYLRRVVALKEQKIGEQMTMLQHIYTYTANIMLTFKQEQVVDMAIKELSDFYQIKECYFSFFDPALKGKRLMKMNKIIPVELYKLAKQAWEEKSTLYLGTTGKSSKSISQFSKKQAAFAPFSIFGRTSGVVVLCNKFKAFPFDKKDQRLLFQFLHIASMMFENTQMVKDLEVHGKRLKLLTQRILDTSEQERKKISEDIHDTLTQTLTGIHFGLQNGIEHLLSIPGAPVDSFKQLNLNLQEAIKQSRKIISVLHPDLIDNIGLHSALENFFDVFASKTGIDVFQNIEKEVQIPTHMTLGLYRILQEAFSNIAKHSQATKVDVSLVADSSFIKIHIKDNGIGSNHYTESLISPEKGNYGLFYMQQRIEGLRGELKILSDSDNGFQLFIKIPT